MLIIQQASKDFQEVYSVVTKPVSGVVKYAPEFGI